MRSPRTSAHRLLKDENGASVVEYGVLIALIIAVCIVAIILLGDKVNLGFESFDTEFSNQGG